MDSATGMFDYTGDVHFKEPAHLQEWHQKLQHANLRASNKALMCSMQPSPMMNTGSPNEPLSAPPSAAYAASTAAPAMEREFVFHSVHTPARLHNPEQAGSAGAVPAAEQQPPVSSSSTSRPSKRRRVDGESNPGGKQTPKQCPHCGHVGAGGHTMQAHQLGETKRKVCLHAPLPGFPLSHKTKR